MAAGVLNPQSAPEDFFIELKRSTVTAYYTSKIGIHTEPTRNTKETCTNLGILPGSTRGRDPGVPTPGQGSAIPESTGRVERLDKSPLER
jgi:hypothetical protein